MRQLEAFADGSDLKAQLRREGYIYLPGFIDRATLDPVIGDVCRILSRAGWLADPSGLELSENFRPTASRGAFWQVYADIQRLESFHKLGHDPRILGAMTAILDDACFCHPAKVLRVVVPTPGDAALSTGAHQDIVRLHVAPDVLTAWTCLSPCNEARQGLRILAGSHRRGYVPPDNSLTRSLPVYLPIDADDPQWMTADFGIGDLVIFHSLTIHAGGPNTTSKARISMDTRYQQVTDPMRDEFARPHGWPRVPDWPDLIRDWSSGTWSQMPGTVQLVPRPSGVSYEEYVAVLAIPPSRLLGY